MPLKRVRGGSGLGDSIYLRPIVEHLLGKGDPVTVCSDYPDVFKGADCNVEVFGRNNINVLGHYVLGKQNPKTNQWQDICECARVGNIPLRFDWLVNSEKLVNNIRGMAAGRPMILVHGGRTPMARKDKFGAELLPDREAFYSALEGLKDAGCFTIQVGKADQLYPLETDCDLNGKTSVADLLDLASVCNGWVAQCSFAIPLAECFDKPALFVWAHRGMSSGRDPYIRSITPKKILSKSSSKSVMDDLPVDQIRKAAREICSV